MIKFFSLDEIKSKINISKIIKLQEDGFVAASKGCVNMPMPGYLKHNNPMSSYHVKYGHLENDDFWVVKIAGGPHHMPLNGMMIAINTQTGSPEYMLQDGGYLTSLRTAVAGLISAQLLANHNVCNVGIIGTGTQARMQLEILKHWTNCKNVYVWGRSHSKAQIYKTEMAEKGYNVTVSESISSLVKKCNLIITTTASENALVQFSDVQPGTHITAVGADSPGKIELDPKLIAHADIVVVDSKEQCIDHGEISRAFKQNCMRKEHLIELGDIISDNSLGRKDNKQITIADLTGIAVQDIQIVKAIISFQH